MPSSSSSDIWCYGLCGAVLATELAVLFLAFRPDVSPAYAAFFLEHRTACYIEDAAVPAFPRGTTIDLSDGEIDSRCPLLAAGWKPSDQGWVKARADTADLRFRFEEPPTADSALTLTGLSLAESGGPQAIDVLADGEPIASFSLDAAEQSRRIIVPARFTDDRELLIRLAPGTPDPDTPGRSRRKLELGLTALRIDPVPVDGISGPSATPPAASAGP
jgi:hypothetical protein